MLMLMYSIYPRANLVTKSYDGCVTRVVFSKLQNCADFSDGDFRDGGEGSRPLNLVASKLPSLVTVRHLIPRIHCSHSDIEPILL